MAEPWIKGWGRLARTRVGNPIDVTIGIAGAQSMPCVAAGIELDAAWEGCCGAHGAPAPPPGLRAVAAARWELGC